MKKETGLPCVSSASPVVFHQAMLSAAPQRQLAKRAQPSSSRSFLKHLCLRRQSFQQMCLSLAPKRPYIPSYRCLPCCCPFAAAARCRTCDRSMRPFPGTAYYGCCTDCCMFCCCWGCSCCCCGWPGGGKTIGGKPAGTGFMCW